MKKMLLRRIVQQTTRCVTWSDEQAVRYSKELGLPREQFVTVRYKANHSKYPPVDRLPLGDFVFSGGDSERDYGTLFDAVRGLEDVPVLVSSTKRLALRNMAIPKNVLLLEAREPFFGRLMASARIVVIPLTRGRIRAAGEASYLNAMWHGRPVICCDDVSAPEYISNGVDGVVVPPGDPDALRRAILHLWHNPDRANQIGAAGQQTVRDRFTHAHFVARMVALLGYGNANTAREEPDGVLAQ